MVSWRNGRRRGFKILCPKGRTGSTPVGTTMRTCGGCVIENEEGKILLVLPSNNFGPWTFPKGGVDEGESIPEAAKRETFEESGYTVELGDFLGVYTTSYTTTHYWKASPIGNPGAPGWETQEVRWVTLDEAAALLENPRDHKLLDKLKGE